MIRPGVPIALVLALGLGASAPSAPPVRPIDTAVPDVLADPDSAAVRMARIHLSLGRPERAIELLAPRATAPPTSRHVWDPRINAVLGEACQRAGRLDDAIAALVHAAAAYGDTATPARLSEVYLARHRRLDGLDQRLADARELSRRRVVFELPHVDETAPLWELPELGRRRAWDNRRTEGRIVVLAFWSEADPQASDRVRRLAELSRDLRWSRVRFLPACVPAPGAGPGVPERALEPSRGLGPRLPMLWDSTRVVATAMGVVRTPATVVIDGLGRLRYRTYDDPPDARILLDQLAELVAEATAPKSLR